MSIDLFALESFIAVSSKKSFTQAALIVGRTQSAVSQQISKLESQLGVTLLLRGKSMSLTREGEVFLSYASEIVQLQKEIIDRFKDPELEGEVRFGLPEDFATVFLSDVLAEYTSLHPRILLNVECDLTVNLLNRFVKKEFDIVLLKMSTPDDFPNGVEVWSEPLEWVGDSKLIENSPNQVIPVILSPAPCVYRERCIDSLKKAKQKWRIAFSSDSYAGKIAAVKAGMGITVLPRNMIPKNIEIIHSHPDLPPLDDTHISLLKQTNSNPVVNNIESFILEKLGTPSK